MRIIQFGHNNCEVPIGIPLIDARVIPNPFHIKDLRARKAKVLADPMFSILVKEGVEHLQRYGTIGVGCGWGHDRSGAVAEEIRNQVGEHVQIHKLAK